MAAPRAPTRLPPVPEVNRPRRPTVALRASRAGGSEGSRQGRWTKMIVPSAAHGRVRPVRGRSVTEAQLTAIFEPGAGQPAFGSIGLRVLPVIVSDYEWMVQLAAKGLRE